MSTNELAFDEAENLTPYRSISTDWETVELTFVKTFANSQTRDLIWADLLSYLTKLRVELGTGFEVWLDGGFTTRKVNPSDVDFVVFVKTEFYQLHLRTIDEFRARRLPRGALSDGYFVEVFPENHRKRFHTDSERAYWLNWLATRRSFVT